MKLEKMTISIVSTVENGGLTVRLILKMSRSCPNEGVFND